jgi:hypothetical protein
MANSTYLKKVVEPFVVEWVSKRIRRKLNPEQVVVGPRTDGTHVHFAFDGVSKDGQVGLLVSTSLTEKTGATHKLYMDASILLNTRFQRRLMAFISDEVKENFLNRCDGLLPLKQIEMLVCNSLPGEMQREIAKFQVDAKSEVGHKRKTWKPGGKRR